MTFRGKCRLNVGADGGVSSKPPNDKQALLNVPVDANGRQTAYPKLEGHLSSVRQWTWRQYQDFGVPGSVEAHRSLKSESSCVAIRIDVSKLLRSFRIGMFSSYMRQGS
jgi:hypothetical protein